MLLLFILFIYYVIRADIQYLSILLASTLFLSSWLRLGKGPHLVGCRAEIRTRACLSASRHATVWATPHPMPKNLAWTQHSGGHNVYISLAKLWCTLRSSWEGRYIPHISPLLSPLLLIMLPTGQKFSHITHNSQCFHFFVLHVHNFPYSG